MELGDLKTYDPLDPHVISKWNNKTAEIYQVVPDMAGYLIKADSEGQPGPAVYNRTLAQGANLFARAVQPYGGVVMFRAFVYNQLHENIWTEGAYAGSSQESKHGWRHRLPHPTTGAYRLCRDEG